MTRRLDIAIIGMSCRLPGGLASPAATWEALAAGRDLVTEIPADRFNKERFLMGARRTRGRTYTFAAGVLPNIYDFDAAFFRFLPAEVETMDPQHRLLIEMSSEALEDAGIPAGTLAGSRTSVYVGIASKDYADIHEGDPSWANPYFMTGNTLSVAANRLSYIYDLAGSSMAVDTACSSSIVALHEACRAIECGDADMAMVGAVGLLLSPNPFIGFSQAHMLSPTGRCRPFDAGADGYVRAEGGGVVLLKPLAKALADGDPIRAVIAGIGLNSDGRTNGIALPCPERQAQLLDDVYGGSGIDPADLSYVEAHGTGTLAGDYAEATSLAAVLGKARSRRHPLPLGSIKSNIGHLEAASGMAGLIKVLLILEHGRVPATLHFRTPNPRIALDDLNLRVVAEQEDLRRKGFIGLNSFGFGGANAHVVLAPPPSRRRPAVNASARLPLLLSAPSAAALPEMAARYAALVADAAPSKLEAIKQTRLQRREHAANRLAVFAENGSGLAQALQSYSKGEAADGCFVGTGDRDDGRVVFAFSGNGAQYHGMGCALYAQDDAFRRTVDRVDRDLAARSGRSVVADFFSEDGTSHEAAEVAQPMLFAVQVGLVDALAARGVLPDAVIGHSVGEVAAAYAAGILTLEQATLVIHMRTKTQAQTRGMGRMAVVGLNEAEAAKLVEEHGPGLTIATINSVKSVTLSGPEAELLAIGAVLKARRGTFFKMLDLDYAFHSKAMEVTRDELLAGLKGLRPKHGRVPFYSSVWARPMAEPANEMGREYWFANIRRPVRFHEACKRLLEDGYGIVAEVGPQPILQSFVRGTAGEIGVNCQILRTLTKTQDGADAIDQIFGQLYTAGANLDLTAPAARGMVPVPLPPYPWQRSRFAFVETSEGRATMLRPRDFTLLGDDVAGSGNEWLNAVDAEAPSFLSDHVVNGDVLFPAAGFVDMAVAAARTKLGDGPIEVSNFEIFHPLYLPPGKEQSTRVLWLADTASLTVESRPRLSDDGWTANLRCRLTLAPEQAPAAALDLADLGEARFDVAAFYAQLNASGLSYGPHFQTIRQLWRQDRRIVVALGESTPLTDQDYRFAVNPTLLDGCLQAVAALLTDAGGHDGALFLPVRFDRLELRSRAPIAYAEVTLESVRQFSMTASFRLFAADGQAVGVIEDFRFRKFPARPATGGADSLINTVPIPAPRTGAPARLPSLDTVAAALANRFSSFDESRAIYYSEVVPLLNSFAAAAAAETIAAVTGPVGGEFSFADLVAGGAVAIEQVPFLTHLLVRLESLDLAAREAGNWRLVPEELADMASKSAIWQTLIADYSHYSSETMLMGVVAGSLGDILAGRVELAHVTDPTSSGSLFDHLRQASPGADLLTAGIETGLATLLAKPTMRGAKVAVYVAERSQLTIAAARTIAAHGGQLVVIARDDACLEQARIDLDTYRRIEFRRSAFGVGESVVADFDLVVATELTLFHFRDAASVVAGLRRLLRPSGMLVLADWQADWGLDFLLGGDPAWWVGGDHETAPFARRLSAGAWLNQSQQLGFVDGRVVAESGFKGPESVFVALLVNGDEHSSAPAATPPLDGTSWMLVVGDAADRDYADHLSPALSLAGADVTIVDAQSWDVDQLRRLTSIGTAHLVHMAGLGGGGDAMTAAEHRCTVALRLSQTIAQEGAAVTLWAPTLAAFPLPHGDDVRPTHPAEAALWGFLSVVENEIGTLRTRRIDLHAPDAVAAMTLLVGEIIAGSPETEVMVSEHHRFVVRLSKDSLPPYDAAGSATARRLWFDQPGALKNLRWQNEPTRRPGENEVAIEVAATGLNFRDVMRSMGLLPDEALESGFTGDTLGMECAGTVVDVGTAVVGLVPGDRVFAIAPACFSTRLVVPSTTVYKMPSAWSMEEAATVPVAFSTAYYALHHQARLQPGERILIHGAAGGVGLAAIQYARHCGAEIFATTGRGFKAELLRLMGVDHVIDSRRLNFVPAVRALTKGEGVDVVLNSISGEPMRQSIGLLRPFGRMLELGKRDFYENSPVGLRPFRYNLTYFAIDLDQVLSDKPALGRQLLHEVMDLFRSGVFRPLPFRPFPATRVTDAFRAMQGSHHFGKLVVNGYDGLKTTAQAPARAPLIRGDGTYLLAGMGGFALTTARWLADQGARTLVLCSRRGMPSAAEAEAIAEIEAIGAQVVVVKADVAEAADVDALLARIDSDMPPLRGVFHTAMVLRDKLAINTTAEDIHAVMRPKIAGAALLDSRTRGRALDLFVLFSSATTAFGNPGQAAYVAANRFLEALVEGRRRAGLPGLAVAWGPIADAGYLTGQADIKASLEQRTGGPALNSAEALATLKRLLDGDAATVGVMNFRWESLRALLPRGDQPKFAWLAGNAAQRSGLEMGGGQSLSEMIAGMTADEALALVGKTMLDLVARTLRIPAGGIDMNKPLQDLGVDSLMAVEIALAIETDLGVRLELSMMSSGASIHGMAEMIYANVSDKGEGNQQRISEEESIARSLIRKHGEQDSRSDQLAPDLVQRANEMAS